MVLSYQPAALMMALMMTLLSLHNHDKNPCEGLAATSILSNHSHCHFDQAADHIVEFNLRARLLVGNPLYYETASTIHIGKAAGLYEDTNNKGIFIQLCRSRMFYT